MGVRVKNNETFLTETGYGAWSGFISGRKRPVADFYIHGSVHRESNLITVQEDATYSVYYISVGSSTCFGC